MTHEIHKSPDWYLDVAYAWGLTLDTDAPAYTNPDEYDSRLMQKTTRLLIEATGWVWHSCTDPEHDNSHSHKCTKCSHEFVHSYSSLACEACHTCPSCGTSKNWDIHKHIKRKPDPLMELLLEFQAMGFGG